MLPEMTFFQQLLHAPVTALLLAGQIVIWFYIWNYDIDLRLFCHNYDRT